GSDAAFSSAIYCRYRVQQLFRVVVADDVTRDRVDAAVGVDHDTSASALGPAHLRVLAVIADVADTRQRVQPDDPRLAEVLSRLDPGVAAVLRLDPRVALVKRAANRPEQELREVGLGIALGQLQALIAPVD